MRSSWGLCACALLALAAPAGAGEGSFTGASGHQAGGAVELAETGGGWEIRFGRDFAFDGAPDPRVGLGRGGAYVEGTDFAPLRADAGAQVYQVPADLDAAAFDTVVIWCRKFAVPLATAPLD